MSSIKESNCLTYQIGYIDFTNKRVKIPNNYFKKDEVGRFIMDKNIFIGIQTLSYCI